jgi:hypothetical protein
LHRRFSACALIERTDEERKIIMIDEIFDRHYREGRAELNSSIEHALSRLGRSVSDAFNVLNRIEYNAPWSPRKKTVGRA